MKNVDLEDRMNERVEALYGKVSLLIESAHQRVAATVNLAMVYTNFEIGRYIVEDEQEGIYRAKYGKSVLKRLSCQLTEKFGKGYSIDNLENEKFFSCLLKIRDAVSEKCW